MSLIGTVRKDETYMVKIIDDGLGTAMIYLLYPRAFQTVAHGPHVACEAI